MESSRPQPTHEEIAALALRVDSAASDVRTAWDLAEALALTDEERNGPAGVVRAAFHYHESYGRLDKRFFVPMMEGEGFCYPPHIKDVQADDGLLWGALADEVASPIARARLNDLCFEGRWGDVGDRGRAAVDAYLEMSAADVYAVEEQHRPSVALGRASWLSRALDLASKMRDAERCDLAITATVGAATESLAQEPAEPGVSLNLIAALVDAERPEADGLLDEARRRYVGDQWNVDETLKLQLRRVDGDEQRRQSLQLERVVGLMDHAESREPLVRMSFLQDAIQLARDYGITDLVDECTLRLQSITEEDLGLTLTSVEIPIPPGAIEAGVHEILDVGSWQDAFHMLCSHPPSGDTAANRAQVDDLMKAYPIRSLASGEVLGGDGLPRVRLTTEEDKREKRIIETELLSIQLNALVLHEALTQIWKKWGPISAEDLAAFLGANDHVRPELADALARAFLRFFNGDTEGAVFTAAPRLEALVRDVVRKAGLPAYRTQRAKTPGQYPGLGALLAMLLAAGFDESWVRYLGALLANPMGANARNELLHGFVDMPQESWATLVFVGVLFLALRVTVTPRPDEPDSADS